MKILNKLLLAFSLITLVGCATPRSNIVLPGDILHQPESMVIGHIKSDPGANFVALDDSELAIIGFAIVHAANGKFKDALAKFDKEEAINKYFYGEYKKHFEKYNYKVQTMKSPLILKDLVKPSVKGQEYAPYDFTFLKNEYNVKYALILEISELSVVRRYRAALPMGNPYSRSTLGLYMVNLDDNSIVAEFKGSQVNYIHKYWDTPPDYHLVMENLDANIKKNLHQSHDFFNVDN